MNLYGQVRTLSYICANLVKLMWKFYALELFLVVWDIIIESYVQKNNIFKFL